MVFMMYLKRCFLLNFFPDNIISKHQTCEKEKPRSFKFTSSVYLYIICGLPIPNLLTISFLFAFELSICLNLIHSSLPALFTLYHIHLPLHYLFMFTVSIYILKYLLPSPYLFTFIYLFTFTISIFLYLIHLPYPFTFTLSIYGFTLSIHLYLIHSPLPYPFTFTLSIYGFTLSIYGFALSIHLYLIHSPLPIHLRLYLIHLRLYLIHSPLP